jgi:drug/metabolite transporter (DMT)-like permease
MLMMAMSPIFAAFVGYFLLGEVLSTYAIGGIIITLVGISSVILVTKEHQQWGTLTTRQSIWGTFLAFVGAIGQGSGVVFAKKGILLNPNLVVHPLSAALVRMVAGAIFIWICVLIAGKLSTLDQALHNSQGMKFTTAGAFVGPFLGVTFSMLAVTYADVGVAQTLMSLMPILIIPLMWVLYRQKTSLRGVFGACIAIIGVSILFLI